MRKGDSYHEKERAEKRWWRVIGVYTEHDSAQVWNKIVKINRTQSILKSNW